DSSAEPNHTPTSVLHSRSYDSPQGEFAQSSADTVAAARNRPEPISVARNSRNATVKAGGRGSRLGGPGRGGSATPPDIDASRHVDSNADQPSRHTRTQFTGSGATGWGRLDPVRTGIVCRLRRHGPVTRAVATGSIDPRLRRAVED